MSEAPRGLRIEGLTVTFDNPGGPRLAAVSDVSMFVGAGRTLAVVGESGSGKSVTALSTLRLLPSPPSRIDAGRAILRDHRAESDLLALEGAALRDARGGRVAMIFQEPMSSLNPVYSIGDQLVEAVRLHHDRTNRREAEQIAAAALEEVGVRDARRRLRAYPHEFSGGMRQRVMIAMALACRPSILLADEPTTALDVTTQAQVLELLHRARRERDMGIMLITHSLGLVARQADDVCVMYAGRVVEAASVATLFARPLHPYTRGLLRCAPGIFDRRDRLATVREHVDAPGSFDRVPTAAGSAIPWWPWREAPPGVDLDIPWRLVEASEGHWIGVWATQDLSPAGRLLVPFAQDPAPPEDESVRMELGRGAPTGR